MSRSVIAWFGILAGVSLWLGCGGGGGGTERTTLDLNGSYDYSLTPGTVTGNGASDCDPSEPNTGTVDVTWTQGSGQCQVVVDGGDAVTASVHGNAMSYSWSDTNYMNCPTYQESVVIHMTSADTASGTITWHCSWVDNGTTYTCSATDTLAVTRH